MKHRYIDMEELEYFYDFHFFNRLISLYVTLLLPFGFPPPIPVKRKFKKGLKASEKFALSNLSPIPSLIHSPIHFLILNRAIGFNRLDISESISFHFNRLYGEGILLVNSFVAGTTVLLTLAFFYYPLLILFNLFPDSLNNVLQISGYILTVCIFTIITVILLLIVIKIHFRFIESSFADSICIRELLYLILDLNRDEIIFHPERKKLILYRIDYLAKISLLISSQYLSKNEINQQWAESHFSKISTYIQERARWIVAPTEDTLYGLRQDFYNLFCMYATGRYGDFHWQDSGTTLKPPGVDWKQKLFDRLIRLIGIVLPLVIMGVYISPFRKILFDNETPIEVGIVAYIFFAWLLITIDITLKLGVIQSLISLAQGLKGLSK